ncbi:prolipoprotein diacylglyceryl transferase [Candidatus Nesciobacter abundans]|uniref:Phosphatidylglycerol--prolipoprotein diacylglyceryl transferase n=1 Tax=Candidatus Nesciobacter abundans TaxID=2601668 RepID=A0A5C0UJY5_9PROT|nr:prolipoprotein diacylglyceryl transferase [Candidatus Nesciobacter abundans]QEK39154.1 prolipoprotein diacylglyceryl transferase [Candidatus Nesciobacter abundans]
MNIFIDPVLFNFFGLQIKWYGVAYLLGYFTCRFYLLQNLKKDYSIELLDKLISLIFLFGLIGGRLGYIFFYSKDKITFLNIISFWKGGMSFFGGFLLSGIYLFYASQIFNIDFFKISNEIIKKLPIGLGLGRFANFINGEISGRVFIYKGILYRHPVQLYSLLLEGIVLYLLLNSKRKQNATKYFFIYYGIIRIILDFFRDTESSMFLQNSLIEITYGQVFGLISLVIGLIIKRDLQTKQF